MFSIINIIKLIPNTAHSSNIEQNDLYFDEKIWHENI